VIFSREHEVEIRKLSTVEHTLRPIDLDAELSLHYQPIVNVGTARLVGFEALARWHNPELGDVAPDVFISVAERTELIGTITQVLLHKALAAASSWPEDLFCPSICRCVTWSRKSPSADRGADRKQRHRSSPHRHRGHRDGADAGL
jgi:predicted signal transduction protein with EAL and GGDEF domain